MLKQVLLFCLLPVVVVSYTTTINLRSDTSCSVWSSNSVYEDDVYLLKWNGQSLSSTCSIKFNNKETDRKLCIKASSFSINDCSVKVSYYGGLLGDMLHDTYSCYDDPEEYCGDEFHDATIELDASDAIQANPGSFTLRIYSKSPAVTATVIGVSVSASIVFTVAVIVIVIIIIRRRRATPGSIMTTYPPPPSTTVITSNSVSSMGAGYSNPNYPGYNYQTQYSQQVPPPQYNPPPYPGSS